MVGGASDGKLSGAWEQGLGTRLASPLCLSLFLQLYITFKTTSSEVLRLVVQELEKTRRDKGLPGRSLTENDMSDFFLVAVNGTQERLLDSHFYPLQLQIQSSKWRLFVKRRSEEQKQDEQATSV